MRYTLPDTRIAFVNGATFALTAPDGSVLIPLTRIDPSAANGAVNVMGLRVLDGGGLRVFYHENLFQTGDDGSILYQDYDAAGTAAGTPVVVSEQGHLFPQTRPVLLTLADGTMLYAADRLNAPDTDNNFFEAVYPRSFLEQIYPYASALAPLSGGGVVWATVSYNESDAAVRLHYFDAGLDRVEVAVPVGSALHKPNPSGNASTLHAVDVTQLTGGQTVVVWSSQLYPDASLTDGTQTQGVFMAIRNADGTMAVEEAVVQTGPGAQAQQAPRVFALESGNFAVVFENAQQGNSTFNNDLYVRTYNLAGQQLSEAVYDRGQGSPLQWLNSTDIEITPQGVAQYLDPLISGVLGEVPQGGTPEPARLPVPGSAGPDVLEGSDADELFEAGDGADVVAGGGGSDILRGEEGDDLLFGDTFDATSFPDLAGQVYRLYLGALGRAADAEGAANWVSHLASGRFETLIDVAEGILLSREFSNVYGNLEGDGLIARFYRNVLGREPADAELASWRDVLFSDQGVARVVVGFSESPEFQRATAAATNAFVQALSQAGWSDDVFRLYQATLDRAPDQAGLLDWTGRLASGTDFLTVIEGFVNSREFANTYGNTDAGQFVTLLYQNVLDRAPDDGGFADWTGRLGSGTSRAEVVQGFSQSREFIRDTADALEAWMRGQGTDDVLEGGAGANLMAGGPLADTFVFDPAAAAADRVAGFEAWDSVDLSAFGYADVAAAYARLAQVGADVVFADGDVSVTFTNVGLGMFTEDALMI